MSPQAGVATDVVSVAGMVVGIGRKASDGADAARKDLLLRNYRCREFGMVLMRDLGDVFAVSGKRLSRRTLYATRVLEHCQVKSVLGLVESPISEDP
jgi:hypothetical protein